ncbi:uncharacterized protein LOC110101597 isoform X2 [Dendrobium catenatum]|nr:uncharacterized protein LOC110101597 isoform X2 [Dendrobium catenatum]
MRDPLRPQFSFITLSSVLFVSISLITPEIKLLEILDFGGSVLVFALFPLIFLLYIDILGLMEGRDLKQPDRSSLGKSCDNRNPRSGVVDSLSSEWTDEKHKLYLSSIEATFVDQLYGREHLSSNFMGWLSRTQKKTNSSQLNPNKQSGQFKVLREGCWEDFNFDRAKDRAVVEIESRQLLANPWVQHFKPPSAGKYPQTSVDIDNNEFSSRSIYLNCPMDMKRTSAKQLPVCYPLIIHEDSVSSRAEVTDQNFVDTEYNKLAEGPSKSSSKKRSRRSARSKIIDQIVPSNSVASSSLRSGNFLKENEAECSSTIREQNIDEPSYYNHEEPEGLGFNNG